MQPNNVNYYLTLSFHLGRGHLDSLIFTSDISFTDTNKTLLPLGWVSDACFHKDDL